MQGMEPESPAWNTGVLTTTQYTIQTLLSEQLDFNKLYYVYNKSSNFTNPSLPQIEMIDIGHKSLPIIIGP